MALFSKPLLCSVLAFSGWRQPQGWGRRMLGSEHSALSIPETAWGAQTLREVLAFCGFTGRERQGVAYLPFSTFPPIFSICFHSNPNRDWVARKAFVSIETICSIRETIYLVVYEI